MCPIVIASHIKSRLSRSFVTIKLLSILAFIACLFLVGCHAQPAPSHWINGAQVVAEYRDEAKALDLAPGWNWPDELNFPDRAADGNAQMYEVNTGRIEAAWYWHCSWARTYLLATSSKDRQAALINILQIRESAFYKWGSDDLERRRKDRMLEDVKHGKLSFFEQTVELNCPLTSK